MDIRLTQRDRSVGVASVNAVSSAPEGSRLRFALAMTRPRAHSPKIRHRCPDDVNFDLMTSILQEYDVTFVFSVVVLLLLLLFLHVGRAQRYPWMIFPTGYTTLRKTWATSHLAGQPFKSRDTSHYYARYIFCKRVSSTALAWPMPTNPVASPKKPTMPLSEVTISLSSLCF